MNLGGRMFIYHLKEGTENAPGEPRHEVNTSMVVVAANSKQARALAADVVIDEPREKWLNGRYSTCRRIGEVTDGANRKARVVVADDNAS